MLQYYCLRFANDAPWYLGNMQILESLDVPLFSDHIGVMTANFDSMLADVGKALGLQLLRYLP